MIFYEEVYVHGQHILGYFIKKTEICFIVQSLDSKLVKKNFTYHFLVIGIGIWRIWRIGIKIKLHARHVTSQEREVGGDISQQKLGLRLASSKFISAILMYFFLWKIYTYTHSLKEKVLPFIHHRPHLNINMYEYVFLVQYYNE